MSETNPNKPEPWVFQNQSWIPSSQAHLALNDAGFIQGATITDMIRTFQGKLFLLEEHLGRFFLNCQRAGIPLPKGTTPQTLGNIAQEAIRRNLALAGANHELAVVLLATPGPVGFYLGEPGGFGDGEPTLIVHTFPVPRGRYAGWFESGAKLRLVETQQVPGSSVPVGLKTRSRMHWWLADRQAKAIEPGSVALIQNREGQITETASANVLVLKGDTCKSPPIACILPGVMLCHIHQMVLRLGLKWEEGPVFPHEAVHADEVLLTGTLFGVAGASSFEGKELPWPGPVYKKLLKMWETEVGVNLSDWFLEYR
ncbi:MAG: hypothetical protein DWI28_00865 [Planctomycetota bacterium]|nr:MAG: hypothetical protein DWI28_00865 [Planctomycetota bacterium]